MEIFLQQMSRTQEDIYQGMKNDRTPVMRSLERTIQSMVPRLIGNPKKVLEVGAGDGFLKRTLKPISDWTELDIKKAESRNGTDGFIQADATNMPFKDNSFDAIIGFESFNAIPYEILEKALGESMRVLRPNGSFLLFHDFAVASAITDSLLKKDGYETRVKFFNRKDLPASRVQYIIPERVEEYYDAFKRLDEESDDPLESISLIFGKQPELEEYWQSMSREKETQMFHQYLKDTLKDYFHEIESGQEVGDNIFPRKKGQRKTNFHGMYLSQEDLRDKLRSKSVIPCILKTFARFKLPTREAVCIPYTICRNKKTS